MTKQYSKFVIGLLWLILMELATSMLGAIFFGAVGICWLAQGAFFTDENER